MKTLLREILVVGFLGTITKWCIDGIRVVWDWVVNQFYTTVEIPTHCEMGIFLSQWIRNHPQSAKMPVFGVNITHLHKPTERPLNEWEEKMFTHSEFERGTEKCWYPFLFPKRFSAVFKYKKKKFIISTSESTKTSRGKLVSSRSPQKEEEDEDTNKVQWYTIKALGKSKKQLEEFLLHILQETYRDDSAWVNVYINGENSASWIHAKSIPARTPETLYLPQHEVDKILQDVERFNHRKKFYTEHGIPARRGYLFYGLAGTGKTSLIGVIASKYRFPIYFLRLTAIALNDATLQEMIQNLPDECILVIEDIDVAFDKDRKPKLVDDREYFGEGSGVLGDNRPIRGKMVSGITFSGLLNVLDGICAGTGRILIMTTNHVEKLDSALIRAGRIDYRLEFTYAVAEQISKMYEAFFPLESKERIKAFGLGVKPFKVTMAEVQQYLLMFLDDVDEAFANIHCFNEVLGRRQPE